MSQTPPSTNQYNSHVQRDRHDTYARAALGSIECGDFDRQLMTLHRAIIVRLRSYDYARRALAAS